VTSNERLEKLLDELGTPELQRHAIRNEHLMRRSRAMHPSNDSAAVGEEGRLAANDGT
jgi:hypothetical protein